MDARAKTILAVSAMLGFLASLAVVLRFWARQLKRQKFGIDDILLILALSLTLGVVIINIIAVTWSRVGEHEIFITSGLEKGIPFPWEIKRESITLWSIEILHTCAMPAIKAYTLAFYLRIFVSDTFRRVTFVVGAYVFCWWVAVLLTTIFQCIPVGPVQKVTGKCINVLVFLQTAAVLNVVSDVVIIVMPIPIIMRLHMPLEQKIALIGIFLTSSLVIVAGIGRTVSYFDVKKDYDFSYHDYYLLIWTSIEPCMGVIGACLPSCRPLFQGFSPESLVGSIRSALSLRSIGSKDNMRQRKSKDSMPLRESSVDGASGKSLENSRNRSTNDMQPLPDQTNRKYALDEMGRVMAA